MLEWIAETKFERLGIFTYSHEENTHAFNLNDDVPEAVKQERAEAVMALQQEISARINEDKTGKSFKVMVDKKEGSYYIGRTEFDSPEVDNEVLIPADSYLRIGDFVQVKITRADAFDLYAEPVV
jgi:ribosomal protein S12 methylthiotransferase